MAVLFSVEAYDTTVTPAEKAVFDDFFSKLIAVQKKEPGAEQLPFADLMNGLDWGNRYVYKGSGTTPPC